MAYYRRIRDMREDHDLTPAPAGCHPAHAAAAITTPYEQGLRDIPPLPSFSWLTFTKHRPIIF